MVSETQKMVLSLLSSALTGTEWDVPAEGAEAAVLIDECSEQGILYLVAEKLMPLCREDTEKCVTMYRKILNECTARDILSAQDDLLGLLHENGFHPVILKGWAAAQYYPVPENRTFGDIDVLVPRDETEQARNLLLENGYAYIDKDAKVEYHTGLKKDDMDVELHWAVGGLPRNDKARSYLEELFSAGLKNAVTRNISGYDIPVLPELQNGIVLLLHIRNHFRSGLGLRQIADWMVYVQVHLNDEAYRTQWKEILEKTGLDELAKVSTALCVRYLGLQGEFSWCEEADEKTVDTLMDFVFEQGNFGHKKRNSDVGAKRISEAGGFFRFMKQLYVSGLIHWRGKINPETYPVLRIFAWFYGLGHYIVELHKKGGPGYLLKSFLEAKKRKPFFAALGLYD